jgi:hypothetical protein
MALLWRTCAGSLEGSPPWGPATGQGFPAVDSEHEIVVAISLLHYPKPVCLGQIDARGAHFVRVEARRDRLPRELLQLRCNPSHLVRREKARWSIAHVFSDIYAAEDWIGYWRNDGPGRVSSQKVAKDVPDFVQIEGTLHGILSEVAQMRPITVGSLTELL